MAHNFNGLGGEDANQNGFDGKFSEGSEVPFGGKGTNLMFESPPASNATGQLIEAAGGQEDYSNMRFQRYQQQPAHLDNFITIRIFLRVSEDSSEVSPDQKKLLFKQLMSKSPINESTGGSHPVVYDGNDQVYIDIEIQPHLNCADLMVRTIDWFNQHFLEVDGPFLMDDQQIEFYQLYMAKKNGKPNDDFPSIECSQIVSKVNYQRFALCFDPQGLHPNPNIPPPAPHQSKDPKKQSMLSSTVQPNPMLQSHVSASGEARPHSSNVLDDMRASHQTHMPSVRGSMQGKKPDTKHLDGGENKGCGCYIF